MVIEKSSSMRKLFIKGRVCKSNKVSPTETTKTCEKYYVIYSWNVEYNRKHKINKKKESYSNSR